MSYAPSYPAFLAVALVYGLVSGGALTLGYSAGSRRFGETARGAFFGRLSGAALIGGAVAPALAAFLARSSMGAVYWMNAAIYAALIALALTVLRPR
jgi:MFS family permease